MHIGIGGAIGSGKSYLGKQLEQVLPKAKVISFATALKDICSLQVADMEREQKYWELWYKIEHYGHSIPGLMAHFVLEAFERYPFPTGQEKNRVLLQYVAHDIFRRTNPDFWINSTRIIEQEITSPLQYVIHDDLRYDNEARYVDIIIEITGKEFSGDHPSEHKLWKIREPDFTIPHMFTTEQLNTLAARLIYTRSVYERQEML